MGVTDEPLALLKLASTTLLSPLADPPKLTTAGRLSGAEPALNPYIFRPVFSAGSPCGDVLGALPKCHVPNRHLISQILSASFKPGTSVSPITPLPDSPPTDDPKLSLRLALSLHRCLGCLGCSVRAFEHSAPVMVSLRPGYYGRVSSLLPRAPTHPPPTLGGICQHVMLFLDPGPL